MIGVIGATLIVLVTECSGNGCPPKSVYPMENMESCFRAVQQSKFAVATGGDAEGSVVIFCVEGDQS